MRFSSLCLVAFLAIGPLGCMVHNKSYRPGTSSIVSVPEVNPKTECMPSAGIPCLAFIEFDEMGEMWEPGNPGQLSRAVQLIDSATAGGTRPAVIILFLHGWKNNAQFHADGTGNVFAFEHVLQYLGAQYNEVPVVGIYMGWRGDVVRKYWPLARQFSYFNREEAAIRIPGAAMTYALRSIQTAAHRGVNSNTTLVVVGHSFGGLVLERALTQATVDQLVAGGNHDCSSRGPAGKDLFVFVNSASAATESKQMLDLLKASGQQYRSCGLESGKQSPLFLSVSSTADAATRFAMPIGHGIPFLRFKARSSLRSEDPLVQSTKNFSQGAFYMSTTAHMPILQSHLILKSDEVPAGSIRVKRFQLPKSTTVYDVIEKPGRWNTTPYWVMEMPAEIVPDHGTIFSERFIQLLTAFLPTPEEVNTRTKRMLSP